MPALNNLRHEQFSHKYIEHKGNGVKAYMETYPDTSYESAGVSASRLLENAIIKQRCLELLEKRNGGQRAIEKLIKKIDSTRTMAISADSRVIEIDDNPAQIEASKTILKMYGLLSGNNGDTVSNDNRSIVFNVNAGDIGRLNDIINDMKAMTRSVNNISGLIQEGESLPNVNALLTRDKPLPAVKNNK